MSIFQTSINSFEEPLLILDYFNQRNEIALIKRNIILCKRVLSEGLSKKQVIDKLMQNLVILIEEQSVTVSLVARRYIQLPSTPSPAQIIEIIRRLEDITCPSQEHWGNYISSLNKFNFAELFCNSFTATPIPEVEEIDDQIYQENPCKYPSCLLTNASKTAIRITLDKNVFCYYRFQDVEKANYTRQMTISILPSLRTTHYSKVFIFKTSVDFSNTIFFEQNFEPIRNTLKIHKVLLPRWEASMASHLSDVININKSVCTIISKYMLDPYALPINELTQALDLTPFEEMAKKKAASQ